MPHLKIVEVEKEPQKVPFSEIESGQLFRYDYRVWMKVEGAVLPHTRAAVCMDKGLAIVFTDKNLVTPIQCELHVK